MNDEDLTDMILRAEVDAGERVLAGDLENPNSSYRQPPENPNA